MLCAASKEAAEKTQLKKTKPELADVLALYGSDYVKNYKSPPSHMKIMHDIIVCRTAALGGHVDKCNHCGKEKNSYNSCRNRHCPKCQTLAKERWIDAHQAELLPVSYFHNVFTLPHELNPIILTNKKIIFDIFFKTVSETLQTFAKDLKHKLQGQLGLITILHTWNQTLLDHFHIHCLIPAGVLSFDKNRWKHSHKDFLFSVKALSRLFRGKFICFLKKAYLEDKIIFPGKTIKFKSKSSFDKLINQLYDKEWVVYSKKPFAGPEQVLKYLGRYTHRIAISNNRILSVEHGKVTFTYKDRSQNNKSKTMTLSADEFIRRYLLHALPKRYTRIRHFGFLSNRVKKKNITILKTILSFSKKDRRQDKKSIQEMMLSLTGIDITLCSSCKKGSLVFLKELIRVKTKTFLYNDSS